MISNATAATMPAVSTSATSLATATSGTLPRESPSILLVDDDELALRHLRQVIELNGLRCVAVLSATDALIYCDRNRPQVVVTDLSMPQLDGGILARWLKARHPMVPIILVTGQDVTDPAIANLLGTVAAILPKPVDLDRLIDLLLGLAFTPEGLEETPGLP